MVTEKQKRFCDEYLKDLNATQAAVRAGYSPKTAKQIGQRMLTFVDLKSYIDDQLELLHNQKTADAQEILEYLTSVMRGEHTEQTLQLVGDGVQKITDIDVSEKERMKAAEMLGKYHALFTDKTKVDGDMNFDIRIDYGDDEI